MGAEQVIAEQVIAEQALAKRAIAEQAALASATFGMNAGLTNPYAVHSLFASPLQMNAASAPYQTCSSSQLAAGNLPPLANKPSKLSNKSKHSGSGVVVDKKCDGGGLKSHPGRVGDPRMNRAVQAKLDNPELSLLDSLVQGGFNFPELFSKTETKTSDIKDTDGVTVYQRRNQLLRRLRAAKQRAKKQQRMFQAQSSPPGATSR